MSSSRAFLCVCLSVFFVVAVLPAPSSAQSSCEQKQDKLRGKIIKLYEQFRTRETSLETTRRQIGVSKQYLKDTHELYRQVDQRTHYTVGQMAKEIVVCAIGSLPRGEILGPAADFVLKQDKEKVRKELVNVASSFLKGKLKADVLRETFEDAYKQVYKSSPLHQQGYSESPLLTVSSSTCLVNWDFFTNFTSSTGLTGT